MRRFNFNNFSLGSTKTESKPEQKRQFSAYRSIITKHNLVNQKLAGQPIGKIEPNSSKDDPQA